jgi:hypothetical protein
MPTRRNAPATNKGKPWLMARQPIEIDVTENLSNLNLEGTNEAWIFIHIGDLTIELIGKDDRKALGLSVGRWTKDDELQEIALQEFKVNASP